jgi:small basic protein (TIGR04137 family)
MSGADKKQRSVLKRTERIRTMLEKGQWKEGDKVYGLPKIKTIRIKIKKEKAEKTAEAASGATAGAPAGAPAGKEGASTKAAPKAAATKAQEKK